MFFINYDRLYAKGLTDKDYHTLVKISQKNSEFLKEEDFDKLESLGLIQFNKSPKDKLKSVRLAKGGKELLQELSMENSDSQLELCDELFDIFDSYGKETGNKRRVLTNISWFMSKSDFTKEQIIESIEEWLSRGYNMWLENIFWNKAKASVFTTLRSRDLGESPLYEFMRRKYDQKW